VPSSSTTDPASLTRGYSIALAATIILSTTAILIRHVTETYHLPPLILAFWRDAFTALVLLPVLWLFFPALLRLKRQDLSYLLAYGLVLAVFNALWTLSVALVGAAVSTVLVYSSAAYTVLLGWWLLKEPLNWAKGLAVVFSLGGCVLISEVLTPTAWQANLAGITAGALSGLCYAVYSLMGRSASQRGLNPWTTLLYTFGFAAVFLLLANLLPGQFLPGTAANPADLFCLGDSTAGWGFLLLLAAGPTLVGFGLYNVSLVYLPSSIANLIATLEPALTALFAYLLLGEYLSAMQLIGSLLILSGVVFLRVQEDRGTRVLSAPAQKAVEAAQ